MSSLIDIAEVRDVINTPLSDAALQTIIDREDQAIVDQVGAHYGGTSVTVTEVLKGEDTPSLFLRRAFTSVSEVNEKTAYNDAAWAALTANEEYYVWADEGRIERLSGAWGVLVQVIYVPIDDNEARKAVLIELVRIAIERTALKSESVAGEYSYTAADDWEVSRAQILKRLGFWEI